MKLSLKNAFQEHIQDTAAANGHHRERLEIIRSNPIPPDAYRVSAKSSALYNTIPK